MAKIIFEEREFKDNNSGITTKYNYIAIAGTGENSHKYEVQLKNLVQSEKMALQMIYDNENNNNGEVTTRKATDDEQVNVTKTSDENWIDELNK